MFNQAFIEEIKYRNSIEDVISSYVRLQRSGANMKGLCPFHSEKTPSFTVFSGEESFYCFGCGAGGDVITFIMKAENLSYPDAVEFLARRAGIPLPEDNYDKNRNHVTRTVILDMNREAAKYFHQCLLDKNTPEGMRYLTEQRKFTMPQIKHFGLGYAPEDWNGLRNHLSEKGYTYDQMVSANLVSKSKNGNTYYDVFRNRMMVPILDVSGNVVAFGGRLLVDGQPKYLNTSDTAAFKKSKQLFALNFAKELCSEQLILCEGYMDVMALHGAGFPTAVATLGTAITPEHARIMKRYTKSVVICYDADAAGQNAADKAFKLLSEVGMDTRIIKTENAKDPDEFIKKFGAAAFKKLLEGSKTRFEYKFNQIYSKYSLNTMDDKIKIAEESANLIADFPSSVERELYISYVSKKLEIPAESLKNDVAKKMRRSDYKQKAERSNEILKKAEGFGDRINPEAIGNVAAARAEENILGLMLLKTDLADKAVNEQLVFENDFQTDFHRRVFISLKSLVLQGIKPDVGLLAEDFSPDEIGRIVGMKLQRSELTDNGEKVLSDCIQKLKDSKKRENTTEDLLEIISKKRKESNRTSAEKER